MYQEQIPDPPETSRKRDVHWRQRWNIRNDRTNQFGVPESSQNTVLISSTFWHFFVYFGFKCFSDFPGSLAFDGLLWSDVEYYYMANGVYGKSSILVNDDIMLSVTSAM